MNRGAMIVIGLLALASGAPADWVAVRGQANTGAGLEGHWEFATVNVKDDTEIRDLAAGVHDAIQGGAVVVDTPDVTYINLDGSDDFVAVESGVNPASSTRLPQGPFTASAWVRLDQGIRWGGIVGCFEDTGDYEKGWVLGYDNSAFTFAVSSTGANDGNGRMTYLTASSTYTRGRYHHVVGTYDGTTMTIYVNGQARGTSAVQSGNLLYHTPSDYVIGAYKDSNEFGPMAGRLHETKVWHRALSAAEVTEEYTAKAALAALEPNADPSLSFVVGPYLNQPTTTSMVVRWETSKASTSSVEWGKAGTTNTTAGGSGPYNEVVLTSLEPATHYVYRVRSTTPQGGDIVSETYQFRTPAVGESAFGFVVLCDTQANPDVVNEIATRAFEHRPRFTLLGGDLVTTGTNKSHWTEHFFPNMAPLNTRVPLIPALGNHEQNAQFYYDYFTLPAPEYYYKFSYGILDVFVLDSEKSFAPGSEQYTWLDAQLAASTATWTIVMSHKPPYSSDEDDYGNLYAGQSTHGDANARHLTALYDKHAVDLAWNGHIHSYERTFPMAGGQKTTDGQGTVYMVTGGAGGGLEKAGPTGSWFSANLLDEHHYTYVTINGDTMGVQVYRQNGMLYDTFSLRARPKHSNP